MMMLSFKCSVVLMFHSTQHETRSSENYIPIRYPNRGEEDPTVGWIVFSTRVPWARHEVHDVIHGAMKDEGRRHCGLPFPETLETIERNLKLFGQEKDIFTFMTDGCIPSLEDITPSLDDRVVKLTCDLLGWNVPSNWREVRGKLSERRCVGPVLEVSYLGKKHREELNAIKDFKKSLEDVKHREVTSPSPVFVADNLDDTDVYLFGEEEGEEEDDAHQQKKKRPHHVPQFIRGIHPSPISAVSGISSTEH